MKLIYRCRLCGQEFVDDRNRDYSPFGMVANYTNPAAINHILYQTHDCGGGDGRMGFADVIGHIDKARARSHKRTNKKGA